MNIKGIEGSGKKRLSRKSRERVLKYNQATKDPNVNVPIVMCEPSGVVKCRRYRSVIAEPSGTDQIASV